MTVTERKAARFAMGMKVWAITLKGQIPDEAHASFEKDVEDFLDELLGPREVDFTQEE